MDPKETLKLLLLALLANEKAEAQDHAENLAEWLSKDGFIPQLDADFFHEILFAGAHPRMLIYKFDDVEAFYPFWFRPSAKREGRYPDIYKIYPQLLRVEFNPKNEESLRLDDVNLSPLKCFDGDEFGAPALIDEVPSEDPDDEDEDEDDT